VLDLKLDRDAATPKDAATVVLVRDGTATLEVFCVQRSKESRFLGGAIVFPGGKLDPADLDPEWSALTTTPRAVAGRSTTPFTTDDAHLRALAVAACREMLEEAAILHFSRSGTTVAPVADADLLQLRIELERDPGALQRFLRERSLHLDLEALHPLSRWVTPVAEARRYDTRFFVAIALEGQTGAHDERETTASFWASPAEVLARWEAGEVQVAPPTHATLAFLAAAGSVEEVLERAMQGSLDPICPRLVRTGDTVALTLPGDPEHEVREQRIEGKSRYVLRGDRWLPEDAS
jgi:8-oxo-dGTP pyrophosphatase MutT (NUDIX family)